MIVLNLIIDDRCKFDDFEYDLNLQAVVNDWFNLYDDPSLISEAVFDSAEVRSQIEKHGPGMYEIRLDRITEPWEGDFFNVANVKKLDDHGWAHELTVKELGFVLSEARNCIRFRKEAIRPEVYGETLARIDGMLERLKGYSPLFTINPQTD